LRSEKTRNTSTIHFFQKLSVFTYLFPSISYTNVCSKTNFFQKSLYTALCEVLCVKSVQLLFYVHNHMFLCEYTCLTCVKTVNGLCIKNDLEKFLVAKMLLHIRHPITIW